MTFRSGKRHRVQESGRSKSVQKLASKLQLFTKAGKVSQSDLKTIDIRLSSLLLDRAERISQLLDSVGQSIPVAKAREFTKISQEWGNWLAEIGSKESVGYSQIGTRNRTGDILLENLFDMDSELFNMLSAFDNSISEMVAKASYQVPNLEELKQNSAEIIALFHSRKKAIASLA